MGRLMKMVEMDTFAPPTPAECEPVEYFDQVQKSVHGHPERYTGLQADNQAEPEDGQDNYIEVYSITRLFGRSR